MAFAGWPEEALDFYDGLEADNSKAYWLANKQIYDECVLAPMRELVAEIESEPGESKIFRPYRDVRFSKDKSPYKTQMGARLGRGYIQLSAKGLAVGDGMYGSRCCAGDDHAFTGIRAFGSTHCDGLTQPGV